MWFVGVPVVVFILIMVIGAMNSDPQKSVARRAYEVCLADKADAERTHAPTVAFITDTCNKLRSDFIAEYGVNP